MKSRKIQLIGLVAAVALLFMACSKKKDEITPPPTQTEVKQISFSDLKKLSTSASVTVPANTKIIGTVISNSTKKNIAATAVVLQDADTGTGMVVNFAAAPTAATGDLVEINISGKILAQVNGETVLQGIDAASLKKTGTGTITPKQTNAKELATNATAWDGTLVTIPAGTFTGGSGKYSGTLQYADSTGTVASVVQAGSAFENTAYPVAVNSLTGIVRLNGTSVQVNLRDTTDVPAKQGYFLTEDFSGADVGYYSSGDGSDLLANPYNYPNIMTTNAVSKHGSFIWYGSPTPINSILWYPFPSQGINYFGPAYANDASFTVAGRNYYSVTTAADINNGKIGAGAGVGLVLDWRSFAKNVKSITVVFAASKQKPVFQDLIAAGELTSVSWNSTDAVSYKVGLFGNGAESLQTIFDSSPAFTDQGVWHTVKFNDPITKYQALHPDVSWGNGGIHFGSTQAADYNRGTLQNFQSWNLGATIVVDKIILEFSQKPEWW